MAIPKSVSSTRPSAVTRMLPGLTSRWTKPAWWAASSADGDARADVDRQLGAQPGLHVEQLAQALAVDELHHDGLAALVLEDVVDGDDVGVGQPGDGDGLAAEALGDDGVGGQARLEPLEGDLAVERDVGGQPHLGHPALRQSPLEPVAPGEHDGLGAAGRARARGGGEVDAGIPGPNATCAGRSSRGGSAATLTVDVSLRPSRLDRGLGRRRRRWSASVRHRRRCVPTSEVTIGRGVGGDGLGGVGGEGGRREGRRVVDLAEQRPPLAPTAPEVAVPPRARGSGRRRR